MNVSYEKNPDGLTAKITVAVEENDYAAKVKAELKKSVPPRPFRASARAT